MALEILRKRRPSWRVWTAASIFLAALIALASGVELSERPDVTQSNLLTKAYYSLGLFVLGGLDIGTPEGGHWLARMVLWAAFFCAPILTASALLTAIIEAVSPKRWGLRSLNNHIVVGGSGALAESYLRKLTERGLNARVVVVDSQFDFARSQELEQSYNATVLRGDLSQGYLIKRLRLNRAKRVLLFGEHDFPSFETASTILRRYPNLAGSIVLRSHSLRFMRAMSNTQIAKQVEIFNTYQLAAEDLVSRELLAHFQKTESLDTVVMAGFGRFGQTIIERLQREAGDKIERIAIIDSDANRRVLVVEEQQRLSHDIERRVYQGDISHPEVWQQLASTFDLSQNEPTIILGTGQEQHNLRTALWLKNQYPNALVYARTNNPSIFASQVSAETEIRNISIIELMEDAMPEEWFS